MHTLKHIHTRTHLHKHKWRHKHIKKEQKWRAMDRQGRASATVWCGENGEPSMWTAMVLQSRALDMQSNGVTAWCGENGEQGIDRVEPLHGEWRV